MSLEEQLNMLFNYRKKHNSRLMRDFILYHMGFYGSCFDLFVYPLVARALTASGYENSLYAYSILSDTIERTCISGSKVSFLSVAHEYREEIPYSTVISKFASWHITGVFTAINTVDISRYRKYVKYCPYVELKLAVLSFAAKYYAGLTRCTRTVHKIKNPRSKVITPHEYSRFCDAYHPLYDAMRRNRRILDTVLPDLSPDFLSYLFAHHENEIKHYIEVSRPLFARTFPCYPS